MRTRETGGVSRPSPLSAAQAVAAVVLAVRLAPGAFRRAPLRATVPGPRFPSVTVVVPARDEEARLPACLAGLTGQDVVVVDDRSTDDTAGVAERAGARVVRGTEPPPGWRGKTWALQQGLDAATGDRVVFLDADTRPRPGLVEALVAVAAPFDLLSAGPAFVCEGALERVLHASMAVTLPLRFGPPDVRRRPPAAGRAVANGQCVVVAREAFGHDGGWAQVAGHLTEDVALARRLRRRGRRVGFVDAADLLEVRMYEGARATWTGWGRSLMAPGTTSPARQAGDVAVLWLAMALPLPRLLLGRGGPVDAGLLLARLGLHAAFARSYRPRGIAFWCAPLADGPVVAWLTWRALRPDRTWRGRRY